MNKTFSIFLSFALLLSFSLTTIGQTFTAKNKITERGAGVAEVLFSEPFVNAELLNAANWSLSKGASSDSPCLTARDAAAPAITLTGGTEISGCSTSPDPEGFGALRLTNNSGGQAGSMIYTQALSTAGGLDIQFKMAQYNGSGADGISFFLKNGTNTIDTPGASGGGLGYQNFGTEVPGVPGALFGIGFDRYGSFVGAANAIAIKGPDTSLAQDGTSGYEMLSSTPGNSISFVGTDRDSAARRVRISVDPASATTPKIRVFFSDITGTLPSTPTLETDAPQAYLDAATFKFGFSASTGGSTNIHEVWDLGITPAVPDVPMTNKCIGGGWYGGKRDNRSNFQFSVQLDEENEVVGNAVWMFKDSSRGTKQYRFKGTLTECVDVDGTNTINGSGWFVERVGSRWVSHGIQDVVITFVPTVPNRKKIFPGSVSFYFPNLVIGTSGTLQGGVVKLFLTETPEN